MAHMSYSQDWLYQGTLNDEHRGPSGNLVQSLLRNPCPLIIWNDINPPVTDPRASP